MTIRDLKQLINNDTSITDDMQIVIQPSISVGDKTYETANAVKVVGFIENEDIGIYRANSTRKATKQVVLLKIG